MVEAARRFAQADRSDPFAMRRAMAHIANGVASPSRGGNQEYDVAAGTPSYYDAEPSREMRKALGYGGREFEYDVVSFRNIVRP
jgi:hypothetical protein